eukprot:scaffold5465_cov202-Prasinococcus_capsulatus_cf.AAC.1
MNTLAMPRGTSRERPATGHAHRLSRHVLHVSPPVGRLSPLWFRCSLCRLRRVARARTSSAIVVVRNHSRWPPR